MDPEKTSIILGPPGTGKTTQLLKLVDQCMESGILPEEICFVSFTRKAAVEAINRAAEKFNKPHHEFPYFKTLHSMAFKQLGMQRAQVMGFGNWIDIARLLGFSISGRGMSEDGTFAGFEKGDRLLFTENLARVQCTDLRTLWATMPNEDLDILELEQLRDTLAEYKRINAKMDFTDMIAEFNRLKPIPNFKILIVDEAQDLSRIQWNMIDVLAEHAEEVYVAGDDDQSIFRWAGADTDYWINLPGDVRVLDQSYRVPSKIAAVANDIIIRCARRRDKVWKPREELGEVNYIYGVENLDLSQGTWLLLARNGYLLDRYENYCTMQGYLFDSPTGNRLRGPAWEAVRIWERLRAGKKISIVDVAKVYDFMSIKERVRYGSKGKLKELEKREPGTQLNLEDLKRDWGLLTDSIWHEALDKLSTEDREYFLAALRNGEKVGREPRIKINTIHAVKGGEAENVCIMTDMAIRTYQEMQHNPDDEARVWYVAVTRAKQRLFIIQPQTMRNYDI
jgi:DNA helicase-2/ATP-dependent DNA helicase PcrA